MTRSPFGCCRTGKGPLGGFYDDIGEEDVLHSFATS
ncbi:hypothetical protein L861_20665 [Litchfieldella anticariensis FP35 = DSM 16096]|uniref:Uncharacterized protein n=1 Tax=Litchfieldella anticariensis (strain DSM 16096 / CECT 5854 / CIP 108499 / LMG 22089 / FP35) TaxID=1121939 RepID=S2L2W4_LITA3|nr:hypothetical protein L861_20665 [Halomonas anticariensis FP35 = DSM 16096]